MVSRDLLASRVRRLVLDPAAEAFPLLWKPVLVILLVINVVLAYRPYFPLPWYLSTRVYRAHACAYYY